jgi:GR25 family glycosyltransferase involved in LPS biosynthesis
MGKTKRKINTTKRRKNTRRRIHKRSTKKKNNQRNKLPKIFVINLKKDKDKWEKYKNDDNYIRYSACNGIEMSQENPYYDKLQIMWNASDRKKKCTAGILNSHMSIIKKIVKQKLNQVLVIEDDAIIDFKKLQKINLDKLPQDSIIYFGGTLHPPDSFKNKSWDHNEISKSFKNGINTIDPKKYRILGGHGYYFPTWNVAKQLIDEVGKKKKMRALDTEMVYLQRKGIIKYFYYPALSYLQMDDAKKGVHAEHILRDMKHYGGSKHLHIPSTIKERYSQEYSDEYGKGLLRRKNNILKQKLNTCMRVVDRITQLYEDELLEKMKRIPIKKTKSSMKKSHRCRKSELHPNKLFQTI